MEKRRKTKEEATTTPGFARISKLGPMEKRRKTKEEATTTPGFARISKLGWRDL